MGSNTVDLIAAVIETSNPRSYWYTIKRRHNEIVAFCKQLKIKASDGKIYSTDCLSINGLELLLDIFPSKHRGVLKEWLNGNNNHLDERSKMKAYDLINTNFIKNMEVGTIKGLKQIHSFIFDGFIIFLVKSGLKTFLKMDLCLLMLISWITF